MTKLSRRRLLQTAALASAATQLPHTLLAEPEQPQTPWPENGTLLPDEGWRLWVDGHAAWQEDDLYLPDEVTLSPGGTLLGRGEPIAANPPSGGWAALTRDAGKEVVLPTTVEQHFWGKYGAGADGRPRPYTPEEYRYAADSKKGTITPQPPADDDVPQNGAYFGVSWWHRAIDLPETMRGKRIFLHIRGARLRAEVYLNRKLVGYSIMEELPFECDLTHAASFPGDDGGGINVLAIRLTNPFGRFDWVDGSNAKWGKLALYRSHGFGGLDRGMTISAHEGVARINDAWILNTPTAGEILVNVKLEQLLQLENQFRYPMDKPNTGPLLDQKVGFGGEIRFEVFDPRNGDVVATNKVGMEVDHNINIDTSGFTNGKALSYRTLHLAAPKLWDLDTPNLYHLRITFKGYKSDHTDTRTIPFGFRTFAPTNLGTNAMFRLNGRRIRLYTSISWGFWGLNGLFPVPELAEKEVTQAKALGLNCLNFHRNLAKEDVLRAHDRLGLLRYMEPGAGKLAIGRLPSGAAVNAAGTVMEKPATEADKFAQRYMFVKCVEMVKAYRSHPSVIEYCLQNEIGADLKNPATLTILKAMHDEDPSRMVVLNDGFVARGAAQAWYEPWSADLKEGKLHRSDEEPWGAFWNNHQGAGDQWYDAFYKSPTDYTYKAPYKDILTEFGEMEGCARPDNHPLMVHQIKETYKKYGGNSYDLLDHEEIISGYEHFIAKWGFRTAFPTAESLFLALGRTEYESWQNYMENARISDELDFAAISGWESTAIENHSGIVDNLRNFKSDPKLIASSLLPIRPIAKQRALCIEQGQPATFDLYLANDTGKPASGELVFTVITPKGTRTELFRCPAPPQSPDVFSYLVKEGFTTPKLTEEGLYKFQFSISSIPSSTQTKELWATRSPMQDVECRASRPIGFSGMTPALKLQLQEALGQSCFSFEDYKPERQYAAIITSGLTTHTKTDGPIGETTGESMPVLKPGHVLEPGETAETRQLGHIDPAVLEAARAGTPLLVIPQADTLSDGCAQQLAAAGAFTYNGNVGDFRAPWMGNWYFVRKHPLFEGMPVDQAMGNFYQAPGRQSNGLLIDRAPNGAEVEIIVGYSRDHDRKLGAGTFTTRLGKGKLLYHRVPPMHPVLQQRFLANAIRWLTL